MGTTSRTLARHDGVEGEVVIRERPADDGVVYELIVNGTFLMDTAETSTEKLLAAVLLERHPSPRRVLVAGLGFGVTVGELLGDPRVSHIDVIEIERSLVDVLRAGVVPGVEDVVGDPRVNVVVDDVLSVLPATAPASYDGVLLDVDNGPDFLVHRANAEVYERDFLGATARVLRPGGMIAVWSAAPSPALVSALSVAVGDVDEVVRTVQREGRDVDYHVYLAQRH